MCDGFCAAPTFPHWLLLANVAALALLIWLDDTGFVPPTLHTAAMFAKSMMAGVFVFLVFVL